MTEGNENTESEQIEHPGLESEQTVGEESINIENVLQENTANEEDEGEHQIDAADLPEGVDDGSNVANGDRLSPTGHHKEVQRKKSRPPRRKLDDNMIAEEEGQVLKIILFK